MKTKLFGLLIVLSMLFSCSISKIENFSQRKYTNFKRGEVAQNNNFKKQETTSNSSNELAMASNDNNVFIETTPEPTNSSLNNQLTIPENENTAVVITKKQKNRKRIAPTETASENTATTTFNTTGQFAGKLLKAKISNSKKAEVKSTKQEYADIETLLYVIIAILIPPLAVFLKLGIGTPFWIDLILTCCFWLPGIIYALLVVLDLI